MREETKGNRAKMKRAVKKVLLYDALTKNNYNKHTQKKETRTHLKASPPHALTNSWHIACCTHETHHSIHTSRNNQKQQQQQYRRSNSIGFAAKLVEIDVTTQHIPHAREFVYRCLMRSTHISCV